MHFEVTFRGKSTEGLEYQTHFSYGLVFIPSPVWISGDKVVSRLNQNISSPDYKIGSVKKLIKSQDLYNYLNSDLEAVIVIRDLGHGTKNDLNMLQEDLCNEGFKVIIFGNS